MFKEFKEFIAKGNVMDMAVGVIIGGAFAKIVDALINCFIQPLLNLIGGADVQGRIMLGKFEGAPYIDYGTFISAVINFLIVAFVLFIMIKAINTADKRSRERLEKLATKVGKKSKKDEEEKDPDTKLCPYCLSEIPFKATKCAHCASDVTEKE
jgi:large conductance mechanosensitive channel